MLDEQTLQLSNFLTPIIALGITGLVVLFFKELVGDLVASMRWKMKPWFEPGDTVYLDGEKATIISIGYRETIFQVDNGRGKVWRYIDNKRIPVHKLEKIIEQSKE